MPIWNEEAKTYICKECGKKIEVIYCSKCDTFYDVGHDDKCILKENPPHIQKH